MSLKQLRPFNDADALHVRSARVVAPSEATDLVALTLERTGGRYDRLPEVAHGRRDP